MALDQNDHDILIELRVKQQSLGDQMLMLHNTHIKEDAAEFTTIKTGLAAAHRRLDAFVSFKNQIIGAIIFGGFVISAGVSIAALIIKKA